MRKSFIILSIVYLLLVFFTFSYNIWKDSSLKEMLYVHNNILLIREQLWEVNEDIDRFFYDLERQGHDKGALDKIQPLFLSKLDKLSTSLEHNLAKYGCVGCHSTSDTFIKKVLNEKDELFTSVSAFKEALYKLNVDKESKKNLYDLKRLLMNKIYILKNSFNAMENTLQKNLTKRFNKHKNTEVFIGFLSLVSILSLLFILYKKILRDTLLLKKLVKNIENNKDFFGIDINSFSNDDLKNISKTLIENFEKIKNTDLQLKRQIDEMESMNEELQSTNQQLEMVTAELEEIKNNLEKKVQEKTLELEEAYKELERSEAIKSSFLQSISHDFKTPLTPLFGYLKLMKNRELGELTPLQEQSLNIMLTCAEKIYNTIDDLILLTKLDLDRDAFLFKDVELNQIVKTVTTRVEKELEEKRLRLILDLTEIPIIIKGEHLILIQMIMHIMRNSIKYTPEGGVITISLSQEDGYAVLRVKDSGQGIADKTLQQINEYFNTKNVFLAKRRDIITVGLSILKKVTLLHNSKVLYKSKKNEGTTVEIYFPTATK